MTKFVADLAICEAELADFLRATARRDATFGDLAQVFELQRDGGLFLKIAAPAALRDEAVMTAYFHRQGCGAEVLEYRTGSYDYLVTRKIAGASGVDCALFAAPERFTPVFAQGLRAIHELPALDCPRQGITRAYLEMAQAHQAAGRFDAWMLDFTGFAALEEASRALDELAGALREDCLLHGDYCLPNVMIDGERMSGVIDVGSGGTGDRHFDLFWALWSLQYNFKTTRWNDLFLDVYGRDAIDPARLQLARAINIFG